MRTEEDRQEDLRIMHKGQARAAEMLALAIEQAKDNQEVADSVYELNALGIELVCLILYNGVHTEVQDTNGFITDVTNKQLGLITEDIRNRFEYMQETGIEVEVKAGENPQLKLDLDI